jgi:MoaA/NifB/PqqE/SkfB family radical SAM enzyme
MTHHRPGLLALRDRFGNRLTLRVSLDHYTAERHETLRGPGTWAATLDGLRWLAATRVVTSSCTVVRGRSSFSVI